ncbi:MAG: hypothetical protein GXO50_08205 [Chlorobi bacterium]|nr:hypothetical protein [Chlorobiota bacterium]
MRTIKYIFAILLTLQIIFTVSCNKQTNKTETVKTTLQDTTSKIKTDTATKKSVQITESQSDTTDIKDKKTKKVKIFKYICPLGCKKGKSDSPGNCPECGMELIENPDYKISE